jgi:flagellar motility protein MotE (MotC chaperone)
MTVMTDALVPALEDAREAHEAVVDRFRADVTITPPGPHRQMLERQMDDVQDSLRRIEDHVRELRPRGGLVEESVEIARFVSRNTVRTVMLPLTVGSTLVTEMLRGRRPNDERRLLRNAQDEYTVTARALAACRAGQSIAEEARDQATAELLSMLRRQDEELLEKLEDSVTDRARAVVAASNGFARENGGGGWADAAARAVRTAAARVQDVAQSGGRRARGAAEGAVREMPDATRMAEGVQGAVIREQELPIARFSQLSTDEIKQQLRTLSQSDLTVIEGYERTHANRPGVLDAIEQLRGNEPWDGYDTMNPDKITAQLQNVPSTVARQVLEYERLHQQRQEVISAAETRTAR